MTPPLVLLHGFAASTASMWDATGWSAILEESGHEPLGIDLLGHGRSARPHDVAAYAEVEQLVVDQLPPEPVDGLGFSAGARVLLSVAAAHPERFRRLVVAGVGARLFDVVDRAPIAEAIRTAPGPDDRLGQHFHRLAHDDGNDPLALAAFMERTEPPMTPEVLAGITAPTLVVLGERDFSGPADPVVEALVDGRLEILRGTDHFATPKDLRWIDLTLDFLGAP